MYVRTERGVGILLRTDSRQDHPFRVKDKDTGDIDWHLTSHTITEEEYNAHKPEPVATTKPKRGAKKS